MAEWSTDEKDNLVRSYGCDLLVENATPEQIKDTSLPNDTYQVKYRINGQVQIDLCSCLLYTSPSPRDRQKSRMPSSA